MRTELLAILPGIVAWWVAAAESLEAAFLGVYLPVLLLLPDNFRLPIDGLPDPTFSQAAILPIGIAAFWKAFIKREWKWSLLDLFVGAFLGWQFLTDFYNVGFIDAQNLGFEIVAMAFFPYICGKTLIEKAGLRAAFARRFVFLLFVVVLISLYEFRMGENIALPVFARFFPGQESGWFTQMRWGLGRISGPYGHAILMGCILSMGLLLCVWLMRCRLWERDFKVLGEVYFTKAQILIAVLVAGMGMTLSRGPWLGGVCGLILASAGTGANWRRAFKRNLVVVALIFLGVYIGGKAYISNVPQPGEATPVTVATTADPSEVEQSTAYRAVLFDKYFDIVMKRPVLGWGRANWPLVPGMSSIDNNYLFVALNTGFVGVTLFILPMLVLSIRLLWAGFSGDQLEASDRMFNFTMLGILAAIGVTTASVFMGSQLYPLFFLFLGWGEACVGEQFARSDARRAAETETMTYEMTGVVA